MYGLERFGGVVDHGVSCSGSSHFPLGYLGGVLNSQKCFRNRSKRAIADYPIITGGDYMYSIEPPSGVAYTNFLPLMLPFA